MASSFASSSASARVHDAEAQRALPATSSKRPHWSRLLDQAGVDDEVLNHEYAGQGTPGSPFLVEFLPSDARNPMTFPRPFKWTVTLVTAVSTLAVSFTSSAYSGSVLQINEEFHARDEVAILGVSMFVLGFAIGPLFWAPFSELYGRQRLFFITYMALTAFNAAAAAAPNMAALVVLRFMAGAWGSSPLTNSGGIIADLFSARERGMATSIFALAPFLGPALGPIVSGFLAEAAGWRWVMGLTAIFTGTLWVVQSLVVPETYAPVLLRRRAEALSRRTGKRYMSKLDAATPRATILGRIRLNLSRPWVLLFKEPIVTLAGIYLAIIYGILYMCFAAFPIVFQYPYPSGWGWRPGVGGLSFVGIAAGMMISTVGTIWDNGRYARVAARHGGAAPPECRLPPALLGAVLLPVGLFWFAWTNDTNVHWAVPIVGSGVFAAGLVLVFLSLTNYLIDSYVIYAASVLAASAVLRSLFGAMFPLFTGDMYRNLGIHWASSIPAFLSLACLPFPYLFYKYGERIRGKCRYSAEAAAVLEQMMMTAKHERPASEGKEAPLSSSVVQLRCPACVPDYLPPERHRRTMAPATGVKKSVSSSPSSYYTAHDSSNIEEGSTTASSPAQGVPCPYREARQLDRELKDHCQIFLEEQLYTSAIHLLNSTLGSGMSRRTPNNRPALIPPPSHLALLNTLTVHPSHTTRAETPGLQEVSALALDYLRNLLAVVGPVNAGFRAAFQFHAPSRWHRRSGYNSAGSDSDMSDGDGDGSSRDRDRDRVKGRMANQTSLWTRGQDLWSTVGWAFNTSSLHPRRWRYWKLWLGFMLDVLEADWTERERRDNQDNRDSAAYESEGDPAGNETVAARAGSMISMHMWPGTDGQMPLQKMIKALFADGSPLSSSTFPEVFDKEPRGPRTGSKNKATNKRKRDRVLDLENDKFGDYFDDDSLSSGISEPPTPQKPRAAARTGDTFGSLQPGLVESVPLRLRFFKLLSAATHTLGKRSELIRLFEDFSLSVKSLRLELFALFVSQRENPLLPEVHVTIIKQLFDCLLPNNYPDPRKVDPEADAMGCLTAYMLERCYACLPANTVALEDNAKLSLVVESAVQLLWLSDMVEHSAGLEAACERGILAREDKAKKRRTGPKGVGRADSRDVLAADVLAGSAERIRALMSALRVAVD
ncbi:hypothetical protein E4U41_003024 [Claviceps citrina]|nr:hypothetical protein E4U41_003024 [Claviceps citrina]